MRFTDRSRYVTGLNCLRKRFWQYHFDGRGIAPAIEAQPLMLGSAVHLGLQSLLSGETPAMAIKAALAGMPDAQEGDLLENQAMVIALMLGYHRAGLAKLLEEFEVIECEREIWCDLPESETRLLARSDALLRERSSGMLICQSFKTCARLFPADLQSAQRNLQNFTEPYVYSADLARRHAANKLPFAWDRQEAPRVEGVRLDFMIKGQKRSWGEETISASPLIYGYASKHGMEDYAWQWEWQGSDGKQHRLSAAHWERFAVGLQVRWGATLEERITHWLDMLQGMEGDALGQQFIADDVIIVTPEQAAQFARQFDMEEKRIAARGSSPMDD
ncbi:MAG: hypothetical protein ACRD22_19760, partial [Terriglobia bacterium]